MMGLKHKGAERALTTTAPQGGFYRLSLSRAMAILTEISLGFSQSLQKNDRIVYQLGHGHFQILSNSSVAVPFNANSVDTGNIVH
jgi:hypothetical protein